MKMKRLLIILAALMVIVTSMSLFASLGGFDSILDKDDVDGTDTPEDGVVTLQKDPDLSFNYLDTDGKAASTLDISSLEDDTKGYFIHDGFAYFCVKTSSQSDLKVSFANELDYAGYDYRFIVFTSLDPDLVYEDHSDVKYASFDGDALICYASVRMPIDAAAVNADFVANLDLKILRE